MLSASLSESDVMQTSKSAFESMEERGSLNIPSGAQPAIRVRLWAQKSSKTSQNFSYNEEFLAGLRVEQKGKLGELPIE